MYAGALYWADKVAALSNNEPNDVYWMAQCMYLQKQYHRAAHIIKSRGLEKTHLSCHYLLVKCLFEAGEMNEALQILESVTNNWYQPTTMTIESTTLFEETPKHQIQAAIMLLKGRIYEALDNLGMAADCYRQSLQLDVNCYEAFEALIQHQMLTANEEMELLDSLLVNQQCTQSEGQVLKYLYEMKLRKYHSSCKITDADSLPYLTALNSTHNDRVDSQRRTCSIDDTIGKEHQMSLEISIPVPNLISKNVKMQNIYNTKKSKESKKDNSGGLNVIEKLHRSLDMAVSMAEKYYYNCQYSYCLKITEGILNNDPYHSQCLPVHIACLVDLKESNSKYYFQQNDTLSFKYGIPVTFHAGL